MSNSKNLLHRYGTAGLMLPRRISPPDRRTRTRSTICAVQAWRVRAQGRNGRRGDGGSSTVEITIVFPVLFTIVMVLAQVTVWAHATYVAQATASVALTAVRADGGTTAAGRTQADATLDQLGRSGLHDVNITVTRNPDRSTVQVRATATSVVPFLALPVHAQAAGPTEHR